MKNKILCSVSTYKRYETTLPSALLSIANQSRVPDKLIIFDDNDEPKDVRNIEIYRYIFDILNLKGIEWEWVFAEKKGQHYNHQKANTSGYALVWRMDDDTVAEYDVLEKLEKALKKDVGAVGGSVLTPPIMDTKHVTGRIENIYTEPNIQWGYINSPKEVDHLHCSFLYRAGVVPYNLGLSRVAHREETLFTYGLKQAGYKILVVPKCITWHLKNSSGGIRGVNPEKQNLYEHDEQIFRETINLYTNKKTLVVLDCGMGDHVVFKKVLKDIPNPEVYTCYPDIVPGLPLEQASHKYGDVSHLNIYANMSKWHWKDSLESAFRKLYL